MAPVIIPWIILSILFINLSAIPLWLDHGYATIRL
jgi:hypothetical protein